MYRNKDRIPVDDDFVVWNRLVTDGALPCWTLLVHLQKKHQIETLQMTALRTLYWCHYASLAQLNGTHVMNTAVGSRNILLGKLSKQNYIYKVRKTSKRCTYDEVSSHANRHEIT